MRKSEVALNIALGISIISWGVAGIYSNGSIAEVSTMRLLVALMNFTIGLLIIFRKPLLKAGSLKAAAISFPSLILGAMAFKMAQPLQNWPMYSEIIFSAGAITTVISFIFLGRNFSILPGQRSIVSGGTYNIVRHPGYLGEFMMTLACAMAYFKFTSILLLVAFLVSVFFRINEEEKLLSQNPDYLKYKEKTKWRLLPAIW